jgi:hypothetical protein
LRGLLGSGEFEVLGCIYLVEFAGPFWEFLFLLFIFCRSFEE